ncbi:MAG: tellurite resistance/C4-dicarboxylate transporter family protein [Gammaproteobacteria bacterium]|nr:tellurite resistance/C4-dicarboxylate transporter family protein [Gammaproteobacteria bacterium]
MRLRFERGQRDTLRSLHPAYFALVMATGIVAIATHLHGVARVPVILFWLNSALLAVLAVATGARLLRYGDAVAADVRSHSRGVGFFTIAAACGVYASQLALQMDALDLAAVFWVLAAVLWFVITYGVLAALTVEEDKPDLADGLNGGWLVSVVATQSLAISTVLVLPSAAFTGVREPLMFTALALWLGGGALYMWLMTLIFFRYTFLRMSPRDLTPPYWINMGAVAISTLAGATILQHATFSPIVTELAPFIKGTTLLFWAVGSWWIPMLVILGVWRYLVRGVPFTYDPLYWGGVFPLGMYSVCTYRLTQIIEAPFLMPVSYGFMIVALGAWAITFVGLLDNVVNPASRTSHSH